VAVRIAKRIFSPSSVEYAKVLKEFGEHMMSRHAEGGRPEHSKWNRCGSVRENALSVEARQIISE
jgi:hypothetical protein